MNKDRVFDDLYEHITKWWKFYKKKDGPLHLLYLAGRWVWTPVRRANAEKLREISQLLSPSAAALVLHGPYLDGGAAGFVVVVEFIDDPTEWQIRWDIVKRKLVNCRMQLPEKTVKTERGEFSVYGPLSAPPPPWHFNLFALVNDRSESAQVLWRALVRFFVRSMWGA